MLCHGSARALEPHPAGGGHRPESAAAATIRKYGWSGGEEACTKLGLLKGQERVVAGLPETGYKVVA